MPWLDENGLLPGRGAPGRPTGRGAGLLAAGADELPASGASGSAGAALAAGLGPGFGPGRAGAAVAAAGAAGVSSAAGAAGVSTVGAWVGAPVSGASTVTSAAAGAGSAFGPGLGPGRAGAFFSGAGAAVSADAFSCSPYSFLNFIATGGSTVDEADLTNSPISFSFSRTNLLSTPNSLASSWTRGLATLLLLARAPESLVCREG